MRIFFALATMSLLGISGLEAASFSVGGQYRFGTNMLSNTDLSSGKRDGAGNTTTFLEHRFLLRPDVVIDERFTVKSEFNVLQTAAPLLANDMGSPLDSRLSATSGTQVFKVRSAYLNWASDWGLFRFGRIPKSWGLGLLYDGGHNPFDDFATLKDRADFQAMLGSLGLRVAYEKGHEGVLSNDADDIDTFELAVDYSNNTDRSDVGVLYSRNVRSDKTEANSSHDLSIFAKKEWEKLALGAEFVSISEENRDGSQGFLFQADYQMGFWRTGYGFAFASSAGNSSFSFNPNYRPFMFLFRQSLGPLAPVGETRSGRSFGSDVLNAGSAGALLNKMHVSYRFNESKLDLGTNFGFASVGQKGSISETRVLGVETDFFLLHEWYSNFNMQCALGLLFPGGAFGPNPKTAWGIEIKGVLEF